MVHRIKTLLILCLDDISIAKEWDSIVIVKPYSNIDELNVDMDFVSKREIKSKVNYDNSCTIVLFNLFYYHLSSFFAEERRNRKKRHIELRIRNLKLRIGRTLCDVELFNFEFI